MQYILKNGKTVTLRPPVPDDAAAMVHIMKTADTESPFLAREPGEFSFTEESERVFIERQVADDGHAMFVAEYEGSLVGLCSVGLVRRNLRYLHRAETSFVLLKDWWGLGIGGKMMEEVLRWCKEHGCTQLELEVVTGNRRALGMYLGFGFEVVGRAPRALKYADGTYADEYRMVKYL